MYLIDQLVKLHRESLTKRNIPFTEANIQRYRKAFERSGKERLEREIASKIEEIYNPVTPLDKEAYRQKRKERAEAAKAQREKEEKAREEARLRYKELEENFDPKDYVAFKQLKPGFKWDEFSVEAELVSIDPDGSLNIKIEDPGFCDRHMYAGKTYKFGLHYGDDSDWNTWTLNADQHECLDTSRGYESYGADVVLMWMDEQWWWDLDS